MNLVEQILIGAVRVDLGVHNFMVFGANVTKIPVKYVKLWQNFLFIRLFAKSFCQKVMCCSRKKAQLCCKNNVINL